VTLDAARIRRYARQILLAPVGGDGQQRLLAATLLLHGHAPLCATWLAAAGLGTLRVTGALPEVAAHDPSFRLEVAAHDAPADLILDLGDGKAWRVAGTRPRLWGGAFGSRVVLDAKPAPGPAPVGAARALLESLAAGEALLRLLGQPPRAYDFDAGPGGVARAASEQIP